MVTSSVAVLLVGELLVLFGDAVSVGSGFGGSVLSLSIEHINISTK